MVCPPPTPPSIIRFNAGCNSTVFIYLIHINTANTWTLYPWRYNSIQALLFIECGPNFVTFFLGLRTSNPPNLPAQALSLCRGDISGDYCSMATCLESRVVIEPILGPVWGYSDHRLMILFFLFFFFPTHLTHSPTPFLNYPPNYLLSPIDSHLSRLGKKYSSQNPNKEASN